MPICRKPHFFATPALASLPAKVSNTTRSQPASNAASHSTVTAAVAAPCLLAAGRIAFQRLIASPAPQTRLAVMASGPLVGLVELSPLPGTGVELGFSIGPSSNWGRGYGTSAVAAAVTNAEQDPSLDLLIADVHEANTRSRRVLERNGFVLTRPIEMGEFESRPSRLLRHARAC